MESDTETLLYITYYLYEPTQHGPLGKRKGEKKLCYSGRPLGSELAISNLSSGFGPSVHIEMHDCATAPKII